MQENSKVENKLYDAIIIGAGVVGTATARELARYTRDILVLEAAEDICSGASKANTAIVHAGYDAEPGTNKAKYNVAGNALYDEIARELDVPFKRDGSLVVSFSEEEDSTLAELLERGKANGVPNMELIDAALLRELEPNIGKSARHALLVPTGGTTCPYGLTIAYAENAAHNGASFIRNARVTMLAYEGGLWRVTSTAGEFFSRAVVNAAGVHSSDIHALATGETLKMTPRRGEYYIVDKSYAGTFTRPVFQTPTALGKGVLVAPTVDGTILIGPNADDILDPDDTRTTRAGLDYVLSRASLTWEAIPPRGFITTFAGVRAHLDEGDFIIGEAGESLFFDAAGIESPGLSSAPAVGRKLAEDIACRLGLGKRADFDPIRHAIPRFSEMTDEEREEAVAKDPAYARVVCRCETVTEAEIRESIRRPVGARSVDGVKRRTRAGMGRCQSGFCLTRVMELLAEELGCDITEITKAGGESRLVTGRIFEGGVEK